jgi:hypothetical protein
MKSVRLLAFGLILGAAATPCLAAPPPWNVDIPLLLEAKHQYVCFNYTSSSGGGKEIETTPKITYRNGLSRDWELLLSTSVSTIHKAATKKGENPFEAGLGDTTMQLKYRVLKETKTRPALTIADAVKFPTADPSRGLGTGVADDSVTAAFGKTFQRFYVFGNAGYNFLGAHTQRSNSFYGAVITYKAAENLTIGAQYYGNSPKANKQLDELAWGVGATYTYAPDHTAFLSLGKSEHGFSNLNVQAGFSVTWK